MKNRDYIGKLSENLLGQCKENLVFLGIFIVISVIISVNVFVGSGIHSNFYLNEIFNEEYIVEEVDFSGDDYNIEVEKVKTGATLSSLMGGSIVSATSLAQETGQGGVENEIGFTTLYGNSLLVARSPITTMTSVNERNEIIKYAVKQGDNATSIAASFGITVNTLLWTNNLNARSIIRPGNELIILPVSGVSHKVKSGDTVLSIAKKYKAEASRIVEFNALPADGAITAGDVLIVPDGEIYIPVSVYVSAPNYSNNLKTVDGYFIVPTTGRNWGRLHPNNAVDIANSCGTPIYAAATGSVIISDAIGWNGGYGKYVKIKHPNGIDTLYSHNSQNLVAVRETVQQGQLIALMGTTGRSTGCHVHFEVRGAKNPFVRY